MYIYIYIFINVRALPVVAGVVVGLLDVAIGGATDSDHPQELVDIVRRVAGQTAKDNEHIVDIHLAHDLIGLIFIRGKRLFFDYF